MMSSPRKFLLLSNGLRDQLGHYFETSVSVAEAARRVGLHPVLGTHVDCVGNLLPDWLESHALFRTDHWMWQPVSAARSERSETSLNYWRRTVHLAERGAYYLLPPLFYDLGRLIGYCCLPRIATASCRDRVAAGLRRLGFRLRYGNGAALMEQAAPWPELSRALAERSKSSRVPDAARRLLTEGLGRELEYSLIFLQDLRRFLRVAGAGPADHVLLQTAHAREVLAVQLAVDDLAHQSPSFHLEFRHPIFERDAMTHEPIESPSTRMQRAFLSLHAEWGASPYIRFYTDSERLSRDYESIADLSFAVLPLPFRAELMPTVTRRPGWPLKMVYLGGARDEKGFHWFPELIQALANDYFAAGKARLLIQASLGQPELNPRSVATLRVLKRHKVPGVELIGEKGPLTPAEYYELASQADIMLLPYLRERYWACTSGILAEALAAGAVSIVPAGTWLADQLPPGGGETFAGFDDFVIAVKRVLDNFDSYRAQAHAYRSAWLERHSPDALVATVVGDARISSQPSHLAA
jgi:hypothetical protein